MQTTRDMRADRTICAVALLACGLCWPAWAQPLDSIPPAARPPGKLIVIGFMGGNVSGGNLVHREALVAKELQQSDPLGLHAAVFSNHDGQNALRSVLHLLDANGDGQLSATEKNAARIVIYGHSWGASETVTLARRLNDLGIPVLLTVQVDSVEKLNEDDASIPPNVREAVNFYETQGLLHGRSAIAAMDPKQTTILGNFESNYKDHPISCAGYPWFARTFMKPHIEIENDPSVWAKVEALIRTKMP
jgi:pimeloyl-ACP methyl ester carboxylesterase